MPRKLTRYAYSALFLIALCAVVYVLISAGNGTPNRAPFEKYARGELAGLSFDTRGDAAPTDSFEGPDGQSTTLQAFQGKPILVNFWATWCAPCEKEMPALGALQTARGGESFQIVAISVDSEEDKAYARQRLTELGASNIPFHYAAPENWDIVYAAGAKGFPTTVIYDAGGKEVARLSGDADWASIEAVGFIDALIAAAP